MEGKAGHNPKRMFVTIKKAFTHKNSALIPHSLGLALLVQDVISHLTTRIEVTEVFIQMFSESVIRNIILSAFVFVGGLGMYIIVFVFDFITGLKASRREHLTSFGTTTGYIQSDKLWSSVWKFFAVIMIATILIFFSSVFALMDHGMLHQGGMFILIFFFFVVISFDLCSIGENQERRFGQKPPFYQKMEWFFSKVEDILMFRITKIFTGHGKIDDNENEEI